MSGLSRQSFTFAYVVGLGLFFLLGGPLWEHPFDIDANIWWSYAALPPLVLALLVLERRLSASAFVLDTIGVVLLKFGTTYVLAAVVWFFAGEPPPRPKVSFAEAPAPKVPAYAALPAASQAATIAGTVRDAQGRAVAGALVAVEHAAALYAPPSAPLHLDNHGQGFSPRQSVLAVGQPLVLASSDGRLHTAQGRPLAGGGGLNYPAVAGKPTEVRLDQPLGLVLVSCQVHPSEPPAAVVVTGLPLWTRSDAQGRFVLRGLPAGALRLLALGPELAVGRTELVAEAGKERELELRLAWGQPADLEDATRPGR